jgi:transcriptional regulator with PAS, ATPase and Fis domain
VCRAIHDLSARREGPFVSVNCAAMPRDLLESLLFGHERGAFTGATEARRGLFEQASRGTLFLDEIGELPLALQPTLLRVLEARTVRRLGGEGEQAVDVRLVAATNRSLRDDVAEGRFRADLFYRLNVVDLRLPTLRERGPGDIAVLLRHFLATFDASERWFTTEAIDRLVRYSWPGNVRELRNLVERLTVVSQEQQITLDELPDVFRESAPVERWPLAEAPAATTPHGRSNILDVYQRHRYNKSRAARELGLSRYQLIRRLRTLGER